MISVIIPLYNKAESIKKTIDSVLVQTYTDFELIVVDDGSTDVSLDIVSKIRDERIIILSQKNAGVSVARNTGILHAKGDWIFLLDADDLIRNNCLSVLMNLHYTYPCASVLTGNMAISTHEQKKFCIGEKEKVIKCNMKSFFFRYIFPRTGNTLIKKEVFNQVGLFNPKLSFFEDLDIDIRILKSQIIAYTPKVVFSYIQNSRGLSITNSSIEKEFAYYVKVNNESFYNRMLIIENILICYKRRQRINDTVAISFYKKKINSIFYPYLLLLNILQNIRKVQIHIFKLRN